MYKKMYVTCLKRSNYAVDVITGHEVNRYRANEKHTAQNRNRYIEYKCFDNYHKVSKLKGYLE